MKELLEKLIGQKDSDNVKRGKVISVLSDNNGDTVGYEVRVGASTRNIYTTAFSSIKKNDFVMIYTPKNAFGMGQILSNFNAVVEDDQTVISLNVG